MNLNQVKNFAKLLFTDKLYFFISNSIHFFLNYRIYKPFLGEKFDIVFYCPQPAHWQNVELVVNYLIENKPDLRVRLVVGYLDSEYLEAVYPRGVSVIFGFPVGLLAYVKTKILYTPHLGLAARERPKHASVIHSMVSLTSLDGVYSSTMFDHYDFILCAGPHHISDFKRWSLANKNLIGKTLVPAGYPKIDLVLNQAATIQKPIGSVVTIVYAPTHVYSVNETMASLRRHGQEIIDSLLKAGFRVIFRPHPVSFKDADSSLIQDILKKYSSNPMFVVDQSKSYLEAYSNADLMVTDLSGTGFTFGLSFLRPTIFFAPNVKVEIGFQGIQFDDRDKIGEVVNSVSELIKKVELIKNKNLSTEIMNYRNATIFNINSSSEYIVNALLKILSGRLQSEWIKL